MILPALRDAFVLRDRKLRIFFVTSNVPKYLQARLVFSRFGLNLEHYRSVREYSESYHAGSHELLELAIGVVTQNTGGGALVFIEDTSVRIEALSDGPDDVPGLRIKEWFAASTFAELDKRLREADDRRATVKSDIALHIPGLDRPIYFHGETQGVVAESPPAFAGSVRHPWLTPSTFNGWFVPQGRDRPLGAMEFEESWPVDFRIRALTQLINRLDEYASVLNLPPSAYSRHDRRPTVRETEPKLFSFAPSGLLIVVGFPAAGKTTLGERIAERSGVRFIEASSVMASLKAPFVEDGVSEDEAVERAFRSFGMDAVAWRILEIVERDADVPTVVTGIRTVEELDALCRNHANPTVVLVRASDRARYERYISRARDSSAMNFDQFLRWSDRQGEFGLLRVAESLADVVLDNDGTLEEYLDVADRVGALLASGEVAELKGGTDSDLERNQLVRCLEILREGERAMSTDEIEEMSASTGGRIRHNNANKVLKRHPGLAERLETPGRRLRYRIRSAGRTYLRLLELRARAPGL